MPQGLNTEIQVGLEKSEEPLDFEPDGLGQVYFGNFTSPEVYFWSFPYFVSWQAPICKPFTPESLSHSS
jgi:hypothetical protein